MTVHSVGLRVPTVYVEVGFKDRPPGSESKLRTYHDGFRILGLILRLARYERPQPFHAAVAVVLALVSLVLGLPVILEVLRHRAGAPLPDGDPGLVIAVIAVLALIMGMLLEANRRVRDEGARLAYLRLPPPEHK